MGLGLQASIHDLDRRIVAWCRGSASACDHSGRRSDHRVGAGGHDHGPDIVPIWPPSRGVARLGATPALDRRQGQARSDHKDGRPVSAQALDRRHDRGDPISAAHQGAAFAWVNALLERRPARLVSVALANKAARISWAILIRGETYRAPTMAAGA
jgi:hypothetical protein